MKAYERQFEEKRIQVHCWEGGPIMLDENGEEVTSLCILEQGHKEPHEFTPGNEILLTFKAPQ